jgi:hypothetical protein
MDANILRDIVSYDSQTGLLHWKCDHKYFSAIKAGDVVGKNSMKHGYRTTAINGKQYYQHRLVWLYIHGEWPKSDIDHVNGDKSDNRIENLRLATKSQNAHNKKKFRNNTSGFVGAYKHWSGRWYSLIMIEGKSKYLGCFATAEEAGKAYAEAKQKMHPFSPNLPSR